MKKFMIAAIAMALISMNSASANKPKGHGGARKAAREACKADVQSKCSSVKKGEGRILCCLKQHESELASACKDSLSASKIYQKLESSCTTTGSNKPVPSSAPSSDPAAGL